MKKTPWEHQHQPRVIYQKKKSKSKDIFWYRTLQLHRRLSKTVNLQELCYVKEGIQDYNWKFLINKFCEGNLCSWQINCQCWTCSPWSNWYLRGLNTLPLEKQNIIIIINLIYENIIIIIVKNETSVCYILTRCEIYKLFCKISGCGNQISIVFRK